MGSLQRVGELVSAPLIFTLLLVNGMWECMGYFLVACLSTHPIAMLLKLLASITNINEQALHLYHACFSVLKDDTAALPGLVCCMPLKSVCCVTSAVLFWHMTF